LFIDFWDNVSVPSSRVKKSKKKEKKTLCPGTLVNNYHMTLCNIAEEHRSHQHRSRSLKSRIIHHVSVGVVLLDLEEKDLPGVAYRVVEQMVVEELIEPEDKPTIMRALLLRHRHVNEHDRFRFGMKRTFSSYTSLQVSYCGLLFNMNGSDSLLFNALTVST
jgi:hypothetical protein